MEYHSYSRWQELGYQVNQGEKSWVRIDGTPVFSENQVRKLKSRVIWDNWDYIEEDYDNYDTWNDPWMFD